MLLLSIGSLTAHHGVAGVNDNVNAIQLHITEDSPSVFNAKCGTCNGCYQLESNMCRDLARYPVANERSCVQNGGLWCAMSTDANEPSLGFLADEGGFDSARGNQKGGPPLDQYTGNRTNGGWQIVIGGSNTNKKCLSGRAPLVCAEDAGNKHKRLNDRKKDYADKFKITVENNTAVCAQRQDAKVGWAMGLKIGCYEVKIQINASDDNEKCASSPVPSICAQDAGLKNKLLNNNEQFDDRFLITVKENGTKVCAKRDDGDEGWSMGLEIGCNRGCPKNLVRSQPSEQRWQQVSGYEDSWVNDWDGELKFSCNKGFVTDLYSLHDNGKEDRRWKFGCSQICVGCSDVCGQTKNVSSAKANTMDGDMTYECEDNSAVTGFYSKHDNGREDREWTITCSKVEGATISKGSYSNDFVNNWDTKLDFNCPASTVLTGLQSEHDNGKEDRRWKLRCGSIK